MKKRIIKVASVVLFLLFLLALLDYSFFNRYARIVAGYFLYNQNVIGGSLQSYWEYNFDKGSVLEEADSPEHSSDPYWWLNSGGSIEIRDGLGKTLEGDLPRQSLWRLAYAISNPIDTDNGYRPQNLMRLITRSKWQDLRQEIFVRIVRDNLSRSSNRNDSNGVFLLHRYEDANNLYYAGIRVDGAAVIKKKASGAYYEMAYAPIFTKSSKIYNRITNPNVLPRNTWIGLRTEIENEGDKSVRIRLYGNKGDSGAWELFLEAVDDGVSYGGDSFRDEGYAGIRADLWILSLIILK